MIGLRRYIGMLLEGYGTNVEFIVRKLRRTHNLDDLKYILQELEKEGAIKRIPGGSRSVYDIVGDDYIVKAMKSEWDMNSDLSLGLLKCFIKRCCQDCEAAKILQREKDCS